MCVCVCVCEGVCVLCYCCCFTSMVTDMVILGRLLTRTTLFLARINFPGVGGWVVRWPWVISSAGASYNLDDSRARAFALAVDADGSRFDFFSLIYPFSPLCPSLWETRRYRLKYCLKGLLNPKTTNQPMPG